MPDLNAWLSQRGRRGLPTTARAVRAWQRILDRPSSVVVYRGGTAQAAQTVRVEFGDVVNARRDAGEASARTVTLLGVADHPEAADTDLRKGDRFTLAGAQYEVVDVIAAPGEIQARAERLT